MMFLRGMTTILLMTTALVLPGKDLKVLMIGNSFSRSVGVYLPQLVNAEKKHHLILTSAYIGDCSLETHYKNLLAGEQKPDFAPYTIAVWNSNDLSKKEYKGNVNELLKSNQYDIITIQQRSRFSYDYSSYEPFAAEIIKFIKKYQKHAEIVIQQTWSYRKESPSYPKLKINEKYMYENLTVAYRKLAEKYSLRVITVGDAVEIFRKECPVKYQTFDPQKMYKEPELPSFAGDVVGSAKWEDKRINNVLCRAIRYDYAHLNNPGEYLQALCWYAFLFEENVRNISFIPANIKPKEKCIPAESL